MIQQSRTSDRSPTILVGTLACGEAEFPLSCAAIAGQQGVIVEHFVVQNQPELQAHRALFGEWNARRHSFDLFVKVDADTVLHKPDALAKIARVFAGRNDVTGLQIGLHDFFSDSPIAGLNCFSSDVSFGLPEDELYCDRVEEHGHKTVLGLEDTQSLYPIGRHCVAPHPRQAFHFGYRRMMKGQSAILKKCLDAWNRLGDDARLWALAGARAAFFMPSQKVSYDDSYFAAIFETVARTREVGDTTSAQIAHDVAAILDAGLLIRLRRLAYRWRQRTTSPAPDRSR